jgi:hypothetical protein
MNGQASRVRNGWVAPHAPRRPAWLMGAFIFWAECVAGRGTTERQHHQGGPHHGNEQGTADAHPRLIPPVLGRSRSLRRSWFALTLAGLAVLSFVLFEALDLDGLAVAVCASPAATLLATSLGDPATDRTHARESPSCATVSLSLLVPTACPAAAIAAPRQHILIVRHGRRPAPRSTPASADPV